MAKLRITWVRSGIGHPARQKRTIQALGLRKLHQSVEHMDSPTMRGMIFKVKHLVRVEEVAE
jgi:large subunit ribosomal protein L30